VLHRIAGQLLRPRVTDAGPDGAVHRSRERYRRSALTSLAMLGGRGITIVTTLVTVPIALDYLGAERYGMWMTISSLLALLSFTDLGIGNGLMNAVAEANGRDDKGAASRYISSAYVMLTALAAVLGLAFALIYGLVPWDRVFGVHSPQAVADAGPALAAFAACFLLAMPLSIVQQVRRGYQEGYVSSLFLALGSFIGLVLVLTAIFARAPLPILVLSMAGPPIVVSVVHSIELFAFERRDLRPRLSLVDSAAAGQVLRVGIFFLVLQVAMALGYWSNSIIAAQIVGAAKVSEYYVATKLFLIPTMAGTMLLAPLWPAYREAITRGDAPWVRATLRRSFALIAFGVVPMAAALMVAGPVLIELWVGSAVAPSMSLIAACGLWSILSGWWVAISMFLNGAQLIRFQLVMAVIMTAVNLPLSIWLTFTIGVAGVVWGSVLSYSLLLILPTMLYLPRALRQVERHAARGSHRQSAVTDVETLPSVAATS
jgi:O-antigen/teichoic acid export membrane protein